MRRGIVCLIGAALLLAGCGGDDDGGEERGTSSVNPALQRVQEEAEAEDRAERFRSVLEARAEQQRREREGEATPQPPAKFNTAQASRWRSDQLICSAIGAEELAKQFKVEEPSPESVAEAYSRAWPGQYRRPSYEGCLNGLENPAEATD